ncbi:MAG: hypothetical protein F4Y03_16115 [Alphaproteobacteria bacterium]|nr:hypothetical protein [Alphaproteobacteria bacterium]
MSEARWCWKCHDYCIPANGCLAGRKMGRHCLEYEPGMCPLPKPADDRARGPGISGKGELTVGIAKDLLQHPNLRIPPPALAGRNRSDFMAGIRYGLEVAATAVSPPKVNGEDEEFSCDDLASFLRQEVTRAAVAECHGEPDDCDWTPEPTGGFMRRCPTCQRAIYSPLDGPLPPEFRALNEQLGLDASTCGWCQANAIREQASPV